MNEKYVDKNGNDINLDKVILDYIEANNLLYDFKNMKVYDVYTYKGSEYITKGINTYSYKSKRIYQFNIGNFQQELVVDLGSFSVSEPKYGHSEFKKLWYDKNKNNEADINEVIGLLKSDIYKNYLIVPLLANLLKVDVEVALKEYEKSMKKIKMKEMDLEIGTINNKIHRLEEEKRKLIEKQKELYDEEENSLHSVLR